MNKQFQLPEGAEQNNIVDLENSTPVGEQDFTDLFEENSYSLNSFKVSRSIANSNEHEFAELFDNISGGPDPKELQAKRVKEDEQRKIYSDEVVKNSELPETEGEQGIATSLVRGAAGGVLDASQNLVNTGIMVTNWADNALGFDVVPDDFKVQAISNLLPKSNNLTENTVRSITQFMVPYLGALKAVGAIGVTGTIAKSVLASSATSFAAVDPREENLSALIQDTMLRNPVTQYLATDPNDSEAEARFKNALEDIGLGLITEGVFQAVKWYKARRAFKKADGGYARAKSGESPPPIPDELRTETLKYTKDNVIDLSNTEFSGKLKTLHASSNPNMTKFSPLSEVPDSVRYDEGLGSLGRVTYMDDTDYWLRLLPNQKTYGVEANFEKAFVLTPDSFNDFMKLTGGDHNLTNAKTHLTPKGYDGIIIKGFTRDVETKGLQIGRKADLEGKDGLKSVMEFEEDFIDKKMGGIHEINLQTYQDQIASFFPEKNLNIERSFSFDPVEDKFIPSGTGKPPVISNDVPPPIPAEAMTQKVTTLDEATKIARESQGLAGDRAININLTKINSEEDVRKVIKTFAQEFHPEIQAARRGKISKKQLLANAEQVENIADRLMNLKPGDTLNAEELLVAREFIGASAANVKSLSQKFLDGRLGADQFTNAVDVHRIMQAKLSGATAEAGRALNALKQETGQFNRFNVINDIIKANGEGNLQSLARHLTTFSDKQLENFSKKSFTRKLWDAALEVRVNGLLSGPRTFMMNFMSNTAAMANAGLETGIARGYAKLRGADAFKGEAGAMLQGLFGGFSDSLRLAKNTMKTGAVSDDMTKMVMFSKPSLTSEAFGMNKTMKLFGEEFEAGKALDLVGEVIRLPGRGLVASDEFFKGMNYRMKVHAAAVRDANIKGLTGGELDNFVQRYINNPPNNIKTEASNFARYNTFTQPLTGWSKDIEKVLKNNDVGRVLFPFVRTNMNIVRYGMERIPGVGLLPGFRNFVPEVQKAFAQGGAARDMVLARWTMGSMIMGLGALMTRNGAITGAAPGGRTAQNVWRQAGNEEYAIKVGDTYYSYNRFDPFGAILGLAADGANILSAMDNEDAQTEVGSAIALAVGHAFTPEFLVENVGELLDIITKGDKAAMEKLVLRFPSTFVPYSSALRGVRKGMDPNVRITGSEQKGLYGMFEGALNNIKNTIPGLSADLPPRRNVFGEKVVYPMGAVGSMVSPIITRKEKPGPAWREIVRLGMASPMPVHHVNEGETALSVTMPTRTPSFNGVPIELNHAEYDKFVQLAAGRGLEGAEKTLEEAIAEQVSNGYPAIRSKNKTDEMKKIVIRKTIEGYRNAAKAQLLTEMPEIKTKVEAALTIRQATLLGE